MSGRSLAFPQEMLVRRAAVQWVRNGTRADDGRTVGRSDAIDAGPRRVARKRGAAACLTLRCNLTAAAGCASLGRTIPRLRQRARECADLSC
jgi:hypothetical protein